ncbi:hypothetical protein glysoja_017576 [Glycine soja]|nr:hypothetical protein glysoja_017576 [Glycine soja]
MTRRSSVMSWSKLRCAVVPAKKMNVRSGGEETHGGRCSPCRRQASYLKHGEGAGEGRAVAAWR